MQCTLVAVFGTAAEAHAAVEALLQTGCDREDIGLVGPGTPIGAHEAPSLTVKDAEKGAMVGGLAGLLLGLTELSIPGIGPVLAGGWLAAMITTLLGAGIGAATGTLAGALIEKGFAPDLAHTVATSIHKGKTVVTVKTAQGRTKVVENMLARFHPETCRQASAQ